MLQLPRPCVATRPMALVAFWLLLSACTGAGSPGSEERAVTEQELQERLQPAVRELAADRPELALTQLDEWLRASREWPREQRYAYELLRGRANLALARQTIAQNGSGNLVRGSLLDAADAFGTAKGLSDEASPELHLAETHRLLGDWEAVFAASDAAIARLGGVEKLAGDDAARALGLRAEACMRLVLAERADEGAELSDDLRRRAEDGLTDCNRLRFLDPQNSDSYVTASYLFRAIGEKPRALEVLQQGARAASESTILHQTLQNTYWTAGSFRECAGFYENLTRERVSPSVMTAWFQGQAELAYGDELRRGGAIDSAERRYERAFAAFDRCLQLEPRFSSSCTLKQAIARLSQARMFIDDGRTAKGEQFLDAAFDCSEQIAAEDEAGYLLHRDGLGKDYRGSVAALGEHFFGNAGEGLTEARRFWRKITARHPHWGFAWNNLGFACRDLGVRVQNDGDSEQAKQLWEESYRAYEKAVEFRPTDARVVNDCGLMLVYHLHRDYERANALFERAIEIGTRQLDLLGPASEDEEETTAAERRDLEEAVGDAWENLAKSSWDHGKDAQKAAACLDKALQHYPYERRGGVKKLRSTIEASSKEAAKDERQGSAAPEGSRGAELWIIASLAGVPSSGAAPGADAVDEVEDAIAALRAGDSEKALDIVETLLRKAEDDPELNYLAGSASLLFARQAIQAKKRGAEANLIDASTRLLRADQLTRSLEEGTKHLGTDIYLLPAIDAIQALVLQGEIGKAVEFAERHATHLDSLGLRLDPVQLARFAARRALAAARKAIADKQAGDKDAKASEESARDAMTRAAGLIEKLPRKPLQLEEHPALSSTAMGLTEVFTTWKDLELWAQKAPAAVRVLGRGALLVDEKQAAILIGTMPKIVMENDGLGDAALEWTNKALQAHGNPAELLWWRAYMHYAVAFVARKASKHDSALESLDAALADYRKVLEEEPSFAQGTKFRIAETLNAKGALLKAKGKKDEALAAWMEAIELWPDKDNPRDFLSGRTPRDEAFIFAMAYVGQGNELAGAKILEDIGRLIPNDWEAFNNAALMLRDLCERQGARREPGPFMKTFERSYANYKKALRIQPANARLANDTALIDVYYLKKHAEESEEMLSLGIRAGTDQLARTPPANGQEKRDLEEAVGDCHMNLGLLLLAQPDRWDDAAVHLEKSMEYYPGNRRASRGYLMRLERLRKEAAAKADQEGAKKDDAKKDEPKKDEKKDSGGGGR